MKYPIAETFYSLKGEGLWTGKPMFFIRLSGCNLNCPWCDTDHKQTDELSPEELLDLAFKQPSKRVVVTGGEPTLYDLKSLRELFQDHGFKMHLETNGTHTIGYYWDWVALSPKLPRQNLSAQALHAANEVKFLYGIKDWEKIIETVKSFIPRGRKLLMPLAPGLPRDSLDWVNINHAMAYCLEHPDFHLCMQMHKIWGVK